MIDRGERGIDAGRMNGCYTGQAVGPFGSNMNYVDLTRTSWMGNAQGLELSTEWFVEALHCWLQWKAEECEGLMLDRGWSGRHGKCIVWCDCGDDSIAPQGSEIGRQRVEAVHWQAVVGQAGGLLGDSGRCAPRGCHQARPHCFGRLLVGVVEQHGCQALTHVPFEVIGQHAEEGHCQVGALSPAWQPV